MFHFNFRYTPKPYFTAPTSNVPSALSSPLNRGPPNQSPVTSSRPSQRPSGGFNTDTWQNQRTQYNYGYNRNFSYARAAQSPNRQAGPAGSSKAATGTGHLSDTTGKIQNTGYMHGRLVVFSINFVNHRQSNQPISQYGHYVGFLFTLNTRIVGRLMSALSHPTFDI